MLHEERRLYSKRIPLRAVVSEATEQVMGFGLSTRLLLCLVPRLSPLSPFRFIRERESGYETSYSSSQLHVLIVGDGSQYVHCSASAHTLYSA